MSSCDALYLHIPFCREKCPYCDFYSCKGDDAQMDAYRDALLRAVRSAPCRMDALDTLYFGGGTPSLFGAARIADVIAACREAFGILPDAEITVECNPDSSDAAFFASLRAAGVNRVSIGMQSVNDAQLQTLGRLHGAQAAAQTVHAAQASGFENISLDLMLGIPGQTLRDIDEAAAFCAACDVLHVSAYLLKIEPGTPFALGNIAEICPDDDAQADFYLHAAAALERHGFLQYEISNFAKDGKLSRHNLKYWTCAPYLGIGPSAHSFAQGRRFYLPRDLGAFVQAQNPFTQAVDDGAGGSAEEYLMLGLRLNAGVRWDALRARTGDDAAVAALQARAAQPHFAGLLRATADGISLTRQGMLVFNTVFTALTG